MATFWSFETEYVEEIISPGWYQETRITWLKKRKEKQFEAGGILLKVQVWKPVNNEIFAFAVPLEEEKSR